MKRLVRQTRKKVPFCALIAAARRPNLSIHLFRKYALQAVQRRIIDDDYFDRPAHVLIYIHVHEVLRVVMLAFTRIVGEPYSLVDAPNAP